MFCPSNAKPIGIGPAGNTPKVAPSLGLSLLTVPSEMFAIQISLPSNAVTQGNVPQRSGRKGDWVSSFRPKSAAAAKQVLSEKCLIEQTRLKTQMGKGSRNA